MSYTAHTWEDREDITAARLNAIENALAAATPLIVECTNVTQNIWLLTAGDTLNKTYREIYDALKAGIPVYIRWGVPTDPEAVSPVLANASLIPVKVAYRYDTYYRIAVEWPVARGQWGNVDHVFQSTVVTFSASGVSAYPTFAVVVYTVPED